MDGTERRGFYTQDEGIFPLVADWNPASAGLQNASCPSITPRDVHGHSALRATVFAHVLRATQRGTRVSTTILRRSLARLNLQKRAKDTVAPFGRPRLRSQPPTGLGLARKKGQVLLRASIGVCW